LKKRQRLNKQTQFSGLYQNGVKIDTKSFRVIYRKNHLSLSRFSVVVGRRFGKAVLRNKAKRIARTLFDQSSKINNQACDILFFPNKNFLGESKISLIREFDLVIEKVNFK